MSSDGVGLSVLFGFDEHDGPRLGSNAAGALLAPSGPVIPTVWETREADLLAAGGL
jgi:hypothetical protein